jgi:hypothetical protein
VPLCTASKVATLASALQNADSRSEAPEALRGLVDAIVLVPAGNELRIRIEGDLAATWSRQHARFRGGSPTFAHACHRRELRVASHAIRH